jgi:hypothetical protein
LTHKYVDVLMQISISCQTSIFAKFMKISIIGALTLGPLHTQAKSHDFEIVRAQKEVSKGRPKTPPKSYSVVTGPQVSCEVICE